MDEIGRRDEGTAPGAAGGRRRLPSAALMGAAKEIVIEHAGTEYILRITSQNKLILTK
jgi:hemin uptake protein HemP